MNANVETDGRTGMTDHAVLCPRRLIRDYYIRVYYIRVYYVCVYYIRVYYIHIIYDCMLYKRVLYTCILYTYYIRVYYMFSVIDLCIHTYIFVYAGSKLFILRQLS